MPIFLHRTRYGYLAHFVPQFVRQPPLVHATLVFSLSYRLLYSVENTKVQKNVCVEGIPYLTPSTLGTRPQGTTSDWILLLYQCLSMF